MMPGEFLSTNSNMIMASCAVRQKSRDSDNCFHILLSTFVGQDGLGANVFFMNSKEESSGKVNLHHNNEHLGCVAFKHVPR